MIELKDKDVIYIYNSIGATTSVWDVKKEPHEMAIATDRKETTSFPLHELLNDIKKNNKTIRVERERSVIYIG